ncbi:MAG: DUF1611 domain-containing protein [Bacteroidota bacterium]
MKRKAIIITGGKLDSIYAKTAHGLIRGSDKFDIVAVIDEKHKGSDAGTVLDHVPRQIPIYSDVADFAQHGNGADVAILGVATKGGIIPDSLRQEIKTAMEAGLGIVNGLHEFVDDIPELKSIAEAKGLSIEDIRKPKPFRALRFWNGDIQQVKCPKIAILGTDCAVGKRTTAKFLTEALNTAGFKAEMIYTGQTGWMQGAKYGFIFDATPNDFVSGELEGAMVKCYEEAQPDIMFIEGQSSLRNPSGPCGSEMIISGNADGVVLQHDPTREQYKDMEFYPEFIPPPDDEIALIKLLGAPTLALTVNTKRMKAEDVKPYQEDMEQKLGIPVVLPLEDGMDRLVSIFRNMILNTK